jgi:hypothetical protein
MGSAKPRQTPRRRVLAGNTGPYEPSCRETGSDNMHRGPVKTDRIEFRGAPIRSALVIPKARRPIFFLCPDRGHVIRHCFCYEKYAEGVMQLSPALPAQRATPGDFRGDQNQPCKGCAVRSTQKRHRRRVSQFVVVLRYRPRRRVLLYFGPFSMQFSSQVIELGCHRA